MDESPTLQSTCIPYRYYLTKLIFYISHTGYYSPITCTFPIVPLAYLNSSVGNYRNFDSGSWLGHHRYFDSGSWLGHYRYFDSGSLIRTRPAFGPPEVLCLPYLHPRSDVHTQILGAELLNLLLLRLHDVGERGVPTFIHRSNHRWSLVTWGKILQYWNTWKILARFSGPVRTGPGPGSDPDRTFQVWRAFWRAFDFPGA